MHHLHGSNKLPRIRTECYPADADPATDLAFSCLINATAYLSRKTVTPIKVMLAVGDQIFQAK